MRGDMQGKQGYTQDLIFFLFLALVEEAQDLAAGVAGAGLLVVHDAQGRRQYDEAELTGGQDVLHPLLVLGGGAVEARADGAALVQATVQVHDDLAGAVVVDDLELTNVTVLLHHLQELHHHLGRGADQHLALATTLRARNGAERVRENAHHRHLCWLVKREKKRGGAVRPFMCVCMCACVRV